MTKTLGIAAFSRAVRLGFSSLVLLAAGSAFAAEVRFPFVRTSAVLSCPTATSCTFGFGTVATKRRWELSNVACRLTSTDTAAVLTADLRVLQGASIVVTYPLIPVDVAGSEQWVVSQQIFLPVVQGQRTEIRLELSSGSVILNTLVCTISGFVVVLP